MFAALLAGTALGFGARSAAAAQPISYIYWDENERELFYNNPSSTPIPSQTYCTPAVGDPTCMVQNWDSNGQMCIFPDTSGRFTTGYNPTNADQLPNPGANLPKMSPPVGEVVWDSHGSFTGKTVSIPGPYKGPWETATDPGGDIPPDGSDSGGGPSVTYGSNTLTDTSKPGPPTGPWMPNHWVNATVTVGSVTATVASNTATTLTLTAPWSTVPGAQSVYRVGFSSGPFNSNGTFTGCVFDSSGNLFGVDLADSQGSFPPLAHGRLIEWYKGNNPATEYTTYCILYGPNAGGDLASGHHVNSTPTDKNSPPQTGSFPASTGGLQQPGTLARDANDNIYVPVDTVINDPLTGGVLPAGRVLEFKHSIFPSDASTCHNSVDASNVNTSPDSFHQGAPAGITTPCGPLVTTSCVFIQGTPALLPLPAGIARDPVCKCWAVSDVIGSPAIGYFDDTGAPLVPARVVATGSGPPGNPNFNPYGIAVDPMGNLFAVDIHLTQGCNTEKPGDCVGVNIGPQNNAGQLLEWMFPSSTAGPSGPATKIGGATPASPNCLPNAPNYPCGYNFPVSVTSCNPQVQTCPTPAAPAVIFPETPWMPALLLAGAGLAVIGVRRMQLRLA